MQKVAAYLLSRRVENHAPSDREAEAERIRGVVRAWLQTKGTQAAGDRGEFKPVEGHGGEFFIERARDTNRSWWMLTLNESSLQGVCFRTSISVTVAADVVVYVTLEAGLDHSRVGSFEVEAHCPIVVRELLAMDGVWDHGKSRLMVLQDVRGYDAGVGLAEEIAFADRSVPVTVVSEDRDGYLALPDLDRRIAFDLAGLANTCRVDTDAAWALSDMLGRPFACFGGSVRLYWPGWTRRAVWGAHPLWLSTQLRMPAFGFHTARERLRRALRSRVLTSSAFGVVRPPVIDEIRDAHQRAEFDERIRQAASGSELSSLAEEYAKDNDRLRAIARSQADEIAKLQAKVSYIEPRLRYAEQVETARAAHATDELAPAPEAEDEIQPPKSGDVRFYKKVHDTGAYDVMREVADCEHNKWQGAHRADKAKKGIERCAGSREWQSVQHCGKCTGGGMWKVRW